MGTMFYVFEVIIGVIFIGGAVFFAIRFKRGDDEYIAHSVPVQPTTPYESLAPHSEMPPEQVVSDESLVPPAWMCK